MRYHSQSTTHRAHPGAAGMPASALVVVLMLAFGGPSCWALAQEKAATATPPLSGVLSGGSRAPVKVASGALGPKVVAEVTRPRWPELTPAQQQALAPLAGTWNTISEAQKRKWLALSQNYPKLPAAEQSMLHSRMSEWVALSPQQRTQARLNFGETRKLAPDDRKAKWEAYQALPPEEKRKLAADGGAKTPATAAAVKPVPAQKLATVPKGRNDAKTPRIATGPQTDPGGLTLQPGPAAPGAPQPH